MYLCVRVYSLPLPAILIFDFAIVPIVWYFMFSIFIKKSLQIPKGGNQKPYIEEEHTTQWPKEKVQKDKQRSTKHTHKAKHRVTRTPQKTGCSGKVSSSCSTSGTRLVNLVTNLVIRHESLSVSCGRSVIFYGYSGIIHH